MSDGLDRRMFLRGGAAALFCAAAPALSAQSTQELQVASAGALRTMLDGPLKDGAEHDLHLALTTHAGGADGVAHSIVTGELKPDVFTSVTAEPMQTLLNAGLASQATPFARTEMVLVYSPKSRFAPQFAAAAAGSTPWWQVLRQPGIQIARSNPANDPSGRAAVFVLRMAEQHYSQPGLAQAVLGDAQNPQQVLSGGGDTLGKLRAGQLDALVLYRTAALSMDLPFVTLPAEVSLSGDDLRKMYPQMQLTLDGMTFFPEAPIFYAAALKGAPNPAGAAAFVTWLCGDTAQAALRDHHFAPAGAAPTLHS